MKLLAVLIRTAIALAFTLTLLGALAVLGAYLYVAPTLPSVDALHQIHLQVPLRVFDRDGGLIAQFGETRRIPLTLAETPERLQQAVLASEDDRFYEHPGVDYHGLLRAVAELARTGKKGSGGSTITMQVARNFFLTREKSYLRKIKEIFLALRIERDLSKEQILELYLNKIYLGNRAYGIGAAVQVYYGKPIDQLTLAQYAMIAGLPKAPSRWNPIANPSRAKERRDYVLGRMHHLGFIDDAEFEAAKMDPVTAAYHGQPIDLKAPYVAEMVRSEMLKRYPETIYTAGFKVTTTIAPKLQRAADQALRHALTEYDRRHGYRGPEDRVELPPDATVEQQQAALEDYSSIGGLLPALVLATDEKQLRVMIRGAGEAVIPWEGLSWARRHISQDKRGARPKRSTDVVAVGEVIRVQATEEGGWRLAQVPDVAGALVSLNPADGAIVALSGGFDFYTSKFNRVIQARRQPGSNFKPVLYSAALNTGMTPATLINDAPVVYYDAAVGRNWRPENYSGKFFGPTRLRKALYKSRNLVSIRLIEKVGVKNVINYAARFGFDPAKLPRSLTLALGTLVATPLEIARAYAVFANGGYRIDPYFIQRIEDAHGEVFIEAAPPTVCRECDDGTIGATDGVATRAAADQGTQAPRVVAADNVYQMTTMLRDVIRVGTGRKAKSLGRKDLAGKTGTTNEQRDAWFSGFNPEVVTTAWVGFDKLRSLGRKETGGRAALPMWIKYMETALDGVPEVPLKRPPGIITVHINKQTGRAVSAGTPGSITETFRARYAPGGGGSSGGHRPIDGGVFDSPRPRSRPRPRPPAELF